MPTQPAASGPATSDTAAGSAAGAGSTVDSGPRDLPVLSRTDPPVPPRPDSPPRKPTDLISGDGLVGTVTEGGTGPCYSLVTDDGAEHTLYSGDGVELVTHSRIRVWVVPLDVRIGCGPGQPWRMVRAELIR